MKKLSPQEDFGANVLKALRGFYSERYSWSKQCKDLIEKMIKLVDGMNSIQTLLAC